MPGWSCVVTAIHHSFGWPMNNNHHESSWRRWSERERERVHWWYPSVSTTCLAVSRLFLLFYTGWFTKLTDPPSQQSSALWSPPALSILNPGCYQGVFIVGATEPWTTKKGCWWPGAAISSGLRNLALSLDEPEVHFTAPMGSLARCRHHGDAGGTSWHGLVNSSTAKQFY